jgi:hypothetical protein
MRDMFNKKRIIGLFSAAMLLAAIAGAPAHADLAVTTGGVARFDAPAPTVGDFAGVTLTGTPQLTSLTISPFTVIDASGSGLGWNVALTIPDLVNGSDTIAAANVSMKAPVVVGAAGASLTGVAGHASPAFSAGTPPTGGFASPVVIANAQAGDGEGVYLVSPPILKLVVPDTALVGTYVSAGTIAVTNGP